MNKSFIKSGLVVIAALVLASCTKTEEFQHNPDSALQIESVSGISPFALTTKAVITGNTLPDSDAATGIGIFVTASDGSAYDGHNKGYTNVNFANSGSGWSTATPVYLSDTEGKLYGYFPYNSNANDLRAIPVQSSLNGTDYLYAESQTVSHSNKSVSLQMKHALSRLHLTIKKGANFTADAPLSKITLKSTAIDATGTMDLTTGAITASKKSGETGTVELPTDGIITAEGIEKDILLVPAVNSEGKKNIVISLMIAGKPAGITLSGENAIDIRSGIQNNVTLTIEDTGIKVSGVGVGEWGEGGSQTVEVSGHKVTVKLDEKQPELTDDIVFTPNIKDGSEIKVVAISLSQKRLECYLDGNASCTKSSSNFVYYTPSGNVDSIIFISHIFTIQNITSDVTATIGYPRPAEIKLSESNPTAYVGESFNLSAIVLPDDTYNKKFTWSSSDDSVATVDENGKVTAEAVGTADIIATTEVGGITATCTVTVKSVEELFLPGEFSVGPAENSKKVRFSRGNLYYNGNRYCLEEHQYDTNPTTDKDRDPKHISHFMWCKTPEKAMALKYDTSWDGETPFFAASDFTVHRYSKWRVLTGALGGEWGYLLNTRTMKNSKPRYTDVLGVSIGGVTCNGLFIYPDDYNGSEVGSGGPDTWADINAAGIVFLPTAGYRVGGFGDDGPAHVFCVVGGYYWSASPGGLSHAYGLLFGDGLVEPSGTNNRDRAYSVRLVTDVK